MAPTNGEMREKWVMYVNTCVIHTRMHTYSPHIMGSREINSLMFCVLLRSDLLAESQSHFLGKILRSIILSVRSVIIGQSFRNDFNVTINYCNFTLHSPTFVYFFVCSFRLKLNRAVEQQQLWEQSFVLLLCGFWRFTYSL